MPHSEEGFDNDEESMDTDTVVGSADPEPPFQEQESFSRKRPRTNQFEIEKNPPGTFDNQNQRILIKDYAIGTYLPRFR